MNRQAVDKHIVLLIENERYQDAFKEVVNQYTEPIYWHLRKMVHLHEDADDLLQEVFTKVWQKMNTFQGKSSFYTWLYRIATNEALNFIRKKKMKFVDIHSNEETLGIEETLKADPLFDGDEAQLQLVKALESLPEKQRIVFQLRYYEELSYSEISELLDKSVGGLRASYHLAAKKIEEHLRKTITV